MHFNQGNPFLPSVWNGSSTPYRSRDSLIKGLHGKKLEEAEWIQYSKSDSLIEEKRMTALCHGQLYQQSLKKAFDKKVRLWEFKEGDLVLKKILSINKDPTRGKWTPNYEGTYILKKAFFEGALILITMDSEELPLQVNSDSVKTYYG